MSKMEILKMFCPREAPLASDKANKFLFSLFLILLLTYSTSHGNTVKDG
jgi:hypothetical protein